MKGKKINEVNACNALIAVLPRFLGVEYELESCPDDGTSNEKEPDFILKSVRNRMVRIAVEHTTIFLFEAQRDYGISSYERAEEIDKLCQGKVPEDRYYFITVPHTLISSLSNKRRQRSFDTAVADWVIQQAPSLRIDESAQHIYKDDKVTLICCGTDSQLNGRVRRMQEYPADVATLQKESFDKAIGHGLDKLRKYKDNSSETFKTVLLLEDVAGLRHERITEMLTSFEQARINESIDYIVVLKSFSDQMIVGYVWKENTTWHNFIPVNRRFDLN